MQVEEKVPLLPGSAAKERIPESHKTMLGELRLLASVQSFP